MSEVSNSIDEANRQRIALGLAPLAVGPSAAERASEAAAASAAAVADRERRSVEETRAELARRKEKRLLASKLAGQSLGESLVSQTAGSARDWIERSRKLGLSEAARAQAQVDARAAEEKARINDDAYTARDLAGAKVAHDFADFASGSEVILTLKDTRVLTGVADGLNEDEDELMNDDMAQAERQKVLNQRRTGKKDKTAHAADHYGEEEAELLSKYGGDEQEKAGLRLGQAGQLSAAEIDFQTNSAIYQQDEARKQMNQLVYSLDDTIGGEKERTFQTDYKEVKFKRKKAKGQAAGGAPANGAIDFDGAAAAAAGSSPGVVGGGGFKKKSGGESTRRAKAPSSLLDFLPEPSPEERRAELVSRGGPSARQAREEKEEKVRQQERDERYLKAIQQAEGKTQQRNALDAVQLAEQKAAADAVPPTTATTGGSNVPPPPKSAPPREAFQVPPPPPRPAPAVADLHQQQQQPSQQVAPPPGLFEEEDDQLLAASLARARRLAQQKKGRSVAVARGGGDADDADDPMGEAAQAPSTPVDSVRALADRVKEEQRVKLEPGVAAAAAAAAAGAPVPVTVSRLPPGMSLKAPAEGLVFTSTTEFVRGLQAATNDAARVKREGTASVAPAAAAAAASAATASGVVKMEVDGAPVEEEEKKSYTFQVEDGRQEADSDERMGGSDGDDQGPASDDQEDDDDDQEEEDEAIDGVSLTGVAAALRQFKARGILKEGGNGRVDKNASSSVSEVYGADKYDAFGNEQSKKEQFRALSHRFHGIEAGLKKQETRLSRVQKEAQRRQAILEQGTAADKIAAKQKAAGSAHIVMDKRVTQELAIQETSAGDGSSKKRKKEAGPFAEFGHGKGGFKRRRAFQEADTANKAAAAAAAAAAGARP